MFEDVVNLAMDIPLFAGRSAAEISVERIGGQTNSNYLVSVDGSKYVLRVAGAGTEMIINRKSDAANSRIASEIGVSTQVLFADENTGVMLREFVEGKTLENDDFQAPGAIDKAATALRVVHESGRDFQTRFNIIQNLEDYEGMIRRTGGPIPLEYFEIASLSVPARDVMARLKLPLAPCHNDLVAANFLDVGETFLVLDWEYSGMNDPMFDLAAMAAEAFFTAEQNDRLLTSYFKGAVPIEDKSRMIVYRVLWNQWVTLWSMVQIANWNVGDNFWDWGMAHMSEYKKGVSSSGFDESVRILSKLSASN